MMKKILSSILSGLIALFVVVSLNACVSDGKNPWNNKQTAEAPASNEPSSLASEDLASQILNQPDNRMVDTTTVAQNQWAYPIDNNATVTAAPVPEAVTAESVAPSVKVALLVPLSGKNAELGQAMLQSAQLALFDMEYDKIELVPQDTKGTADGAAIAAQLAIADGAQLILGPIFAAEARAVAPIAQQRNINVVTFSTDWTLAQGNVFVMGFLPFTQVERIAQYAASQRLQRVGIIAPETEYGNVVVSAWNVNASRNGMPPASILRVTPGSAAASEKINAFTNGEARTAAAKAGQPMPAPFDAVFMPVGGSEAVSLADSLSFYELDPQSVRRLGTGLWDDNSLAAQKSMDGAWFAASDPSLRKPFERRYYDAYGAAPPRLSTLAYDATSLAVVLAKTGYANYGAPSFDRTAIGNPNGFAGIDGIFRFRPDGMAERGLAILEFRNGSMQVVDPAPRSFVRSQY